MAMMWAAGMTQVRVADRLNLNTSQVCQLIKRFCDLHTNRDVAEERIYGDERKQAAALAVRAFRSTGRSICSPDKLSKPSVHDREWFVAHREHAYMLRCEGLTYKQIGQRMGIPHYRAYQYTLTFMNYLRRAARRCRMHIYATNGDLIPDTRFDIMAKAHGFSTRSQASVP